MTGPIMPLMVKGKGWRLGRPYAELAFVAGVTALLLALVADRTRYGIQALAPILVYAFAAGFGLEFVSASWCGRWRPEGQPRGRRR
jgi:hypothetical protein